MRVAVVSRFYPNAAEPLRTLFVRDLVQALARAARVAVVAPIPHAPGAGWTSTRWRALRAVPRRTQQGDLEIFHPRYLVIPKFPPLSGRTYFAAVLPTLRRLADAGGIDVLHAHCAYPDAVGVAHAASALGLPFVVTAHGSDINGAARLPFVRGQLVRAFRRAAAVIAVSAALGEKIRELVPEVADRVVHIPCAAADSGLFGVRDTHAARRRLGLEEDARVVLFVGRLVPIKGADSLLRAWQMLSARRGIGERDRLVIIGDGPERAGLEAFSRSHGLSGSVRFLGAMPQETIPGWMSAATLFCLSSLNEGTPNVVIEALASGRPVVATRVGGLPELVTEGESGLLVEPRNSGRLADALAAALDRHWDPQRIAASVAELTWDRLARRNLDVLEGIVAERQRWVGAA